MDFEQPIAELDARIEELRRTVDNGTLNISDELRRLEVKCAGLTKSIFAKLTPWQIAQLARHPNRPHTLDYVRRLFTDFIELHGDRAFADDPAIVGGIARLDGKPVVVIGHQKGRSTQEKVHRNFGMPRPEGYRKAKRLMLFAQKFALPLISFIDTPGAYPGIDAEERGQSAAIAENLRLMAELRVPIIAVVIGEGGSGGALAIGVCDRLAMLEFATYSVISPEGCAAILWKSNDKADLAAKAMGITAAKLNALGLIDIVIEEPMGGAHRDVEASAQRVAGGLRRLLADVRSLTIEDLLNTRRARLAKYGAFSTD